MQTYILLGISPSALSSLYPPPPPSDNFLTTVMLLPYRSGLNASVPRFLRVTWTSATLQNWHTRDIELVCLTVIPLDFTVLNSTHNLKNWLKHCQNRQTFQARVPYLLFDLMKPLMLDPRLVILAFPPSPTTIPVRIADLPP